MIYRKSASDDYKHNPFKVTIVLKKKQKVKRRINQWLYRDADSDFASAFDWGSQ